MTTTLKFITPFLLIALYSCGQNTDKQKVDPKVTVLTNKIIPLVNYKENPDSCEQALLYLDSATKIDNSCFLCYHNKLMFLYSLKQFDKAVETMNECIRLKPYAHDLYLAGGILYEKVGNTNSSKKYFQKSLTILNSLLDTMKVQDMNYEMLVTNKAINLIMLNDKKTGNNLLKGIADRQQEPQSKALTLSYIDKSREDLVEMMTTNQYSR